jgi:hypothetical protein
MPLVKPERFKGAVPFACVIAVVVFMISWPVISFMEIYAVVLFRLHQSIFNIDEVGLGYQLMMQVPEETPVVSPVDEPIVATAKLLLIHVPVEAESVIMVDVTLTQTLSDPPMAALVLVVANVATKIIANVNDFLITDCFLL